MIAAAAVGLGLAVGALVGSDGHGDGAASAPDSRASTSSSSLPAGAGWQVLELAGRPSAVSADGDQLLVVDDELGLVQTVDAASRSLTSTTPLGGALVGVDLGPERASGGWAVDARGTATRFGGGPAPQPVDVGGTLSDVWVGEDVAYAADLESSQVVELVAGTGVSRRFDLPDGVVRLDGADGALWVTGRDRTVTRIDLATGAVGAPAEVGNGPIGVIVAAGTVWVANGDDGTVSRLDAATGARRGPDVAVGGGPTAIAVHGDDVWVLNHDAATVSHLSAATGQRVEPDRPVPEALSRPRDLDVTDDGTVWVVGVDRSLLAALPPR